MSMEAAAGAISRSEEALATSLANCHAWQEWLGGNAAAALARIHLGWTPRGEKENYTLAEIAQRMPCMVVYASEQMGQGWQWRRLADSTIADGGTLAMEIQIASPGNLDQAGGDTAAEYRRKLVNFLGKLMVYADDGKRGLFQDDNHEYLEIKGASTLGPLRSDKQDHAAQGDWWQMLVWLQVGTII